MDDDGWLDPVLVDPLPPPPPDRITGPGARVYAVHTLAGIEPYRWHTTVVLAWARLPDGSPACLAAWHGMQRQPFGPPRVAGRWSWCRYDREVFRSVEPARVPNPWSLSWHGLPVTDPINVAIMEAAASLPTGMRELAALPVDRDAKMSQ